MGWSFIGTTTSMSHAATDSRIQDQRPSALAPCACCALPSLTHLDLFSGIGGFALAARMVGQIETVAFCEREAYAQRVLKKHWPHLPICDDIHNLRGNDYGPIDLITGGFPCQPYSLAGKRGGNDDDRALWPQMLRVIREARPTWVIGENVPGIISLALDGVLADLESAGYACETFALPACAVDAKHRRNRIWIVGYSERPERRPKCGACEGLAGQDCLSQRKESPSGSGVTSQTMAQPNGISGRAGTRRQWHMENSDGAAYGLRRDWCPEPDVGRVAHGIPARVDRLRGLGNAIVPQVAAALLSKIVEVHFGTVARHNSMICGDPAALSPENTDLQINSKAKSAHD